MSILFTFDTNKLFWIREPKAKVVQPEKIAITTEPHTDLWQRTYYGFQNDNAPILCMKTAEPFFSFSVKTAFDSQNRFDQCGVIVYQDSENWIKASVEYENDNYQRLGSVVTNNGYSDWATTDISAEIKIMYYRLSRRKDDFLVECSVDGIEYQQMRICHLHRAERSICFGVYACSPEASSCEAEFTEMTVTPCQWKSHTMPLEGEKNE
ncbi:DUF1349 domain-containing protein [Listeria kieliensis]|uniref:DUF1349 domain-containing protein n=1 Tax=Listeria kieliensis TaxID=1621700 RepID=UPI001F0BB284|nr:DUF1349 domain-containing protein [Listeria kieliensis]